METHPKLPTDPHVAGTLIYGAAETVLFTEETTDVGVRFLRERLRGVRWKHIPIPGGIIAAIVDALLPGLALALVKAILQSLGMLESDRHADPNNPFTR